MTTLPRSARYRLRNWRTLYRWMTGAAPAGYDDAFWDFHEEADWPAFAQCVLAHAPAASMIDVGCGAGSLLAAIRDAQPALRVLGVDGSGPGLRRASKRGLPVRQADLAMWRRRQSEGLRRVVADHDVALCLEVAEHLPPWSAAHLVRALAAAPLVVFSAARPDQGGTLHMNEQPFRYWERLFNRAGLSVSPSDEAFREAVASLRVPSWYRDNIHLLTRA